MSPIPAFPSFDIYLADLNLFILELVEAYQVGKIKSWDDLQEKVNAYFTPVRIQHTEILVPGWRKMASYVQGVTLVHVMCVFLGLYMMPEFLIMTQAQQQMMKWVILFHDIEKEPRNGKRDHGHAFRSAIAAAETLPKLGFSITSEYGLLINDWIDLTRSLTTKPENFPDYVQDNLKLPQILAGIERMFGHNTPAALIIKTILFHLSIDMQLWPPVTPLTDEEVRMYLDQDLIVLLRVMSLGDSEGWNMFQPDRESLQNAVVEAFKKVGC
jgi:hypothetical protein